MAEPVEAATESWDWLLFSEGPETSLGGTFDAPAEGEIRGNYIAVSNVYGYTIVVVPKGFRVMKTSELNGSGPEAGGAAAAPTVMVPVSGTIFGIALASDELTFAVASGSQKTTPYHTINCTGTIRDIKFSRNPKSHLLGVLVSSSQDDGNVLLYDATDLSKKTASGSAFGDHVAAFDFAYGGSAAEEIITCAQDGTIEAFTINPDLSGTSKFTRAAPGVPGEGPISAVLHILWWGKDKIFITAIVGDGLGYYFMVSPDAAAQSTYFIAGSVQPSTVYTLTAALTYLRLLVILSPQAVTEEAVGLADTKQWVTVNCNEDKKLTLPPDDRSETGIAIPLGVALDRTSQKQLPAPAAGEPPISPVPILFVPTSIGKVVSFHVIDGNNKQKSPAVMINNVQPLPSAPIKRSGQGSSTTAASVPAASAPSLTGFRAGGLGAPATFSPTPSTSATAAAQTPATQPSSSFGFAIGDNKPTSFSLGGAAKKEPATPVSFGGPASFGPAPTNTTGNSSFAPTNETKPPASTSLAFGGGSTTSFASPAAKTPAPAPNVLAPTAGTSLSLGGVSPKAGATFAAPATPATAGTFAAPAPISAAPKVAAPAPSLRASGSIPADPAPPASSPGFANLSSLASTASSLTSVAKIPAPQPNLPSASPTSASAQPVRPVPTIASTPPAVAKMTASVVPPSAPAASASASASAARTVANQFAEEVQSFRDDIQQVHTYASEIQQIMTEAASGESEKKKTKFRFRDFERLVQDTVALRRQYNEVAAEYETAHKEMTSVKQMYIESITERAEAKSQMEMRDNPQYRRLIQKRQLDPEARALRAKMHDATLRVETALHQVEEQLTSIHNEKYRATVKDGKRPHIKLLSHHLNLKDKPIAGDELIVQRPSWETLWATLRQNVQIIRSQQNRVSEMSQSLDRLKRSKSNRSSRLGSQSQSIRSSISLTKPAAVPAAPSRSNSTYDPAERKTRAEERKRRGKRLSLFKEVLTEAATGPDRWIAVRKQADFKADEALALKEEKERKREQDSKRLAEREAERSKVVSSIQVPSTPSTPSSVMPTEKSTPISVHYTNAFPGTEKPTPATPTSPLTASQPTAPSIASPVPKPAIPAPAPVPMTAGRPSLSALTSSPATGTSGLLIPPTKLPPALGGLGASMLGESMFGSESDDTPAASAARSTANVAKALANMPSGPSSISSAPPATTSSSPFGSASTAPGQASQTSPTKSGKSKLGKIAVTTPSEFAFGASAPQRASLSMSQSLQVDSEDDEGSFSESEDPQEDPPSPIKKPTVKQAASAGFAKFNISSLGTTLPPTNSSAQAATAPAAAPAAAPSKTSPLQSLGTSGFGTFAAPAPAPTKTPAGFGLSSLSGITAASSATQPTASSAPAPVSAAPSGAAKKLDFGAALSAKLTSAVAPTSAPAPTQAKAKAASALRQLLPQSDEEEEEEPEDVSGEEGDPNTTAYDEELGQEEEEGEEEEGEWSSEELGEDDDGELTRPSSPVGEQSDESAAPQPLKVVVKNASSGLTSSTGAGATLASSFGSVLGAPAKASAPAPAGASGFGSGFGAAPAKQPAATNFAAFGSTSAKSTAAAPTSSPTSAAVSAPSSAASFGTGFGATSAAASPTAPKTSFGGGFGAPTATAAPSTTGSSGFGAGFGAPAKAAATGTSPGTSFGGSGFGASAPAPSNPPAATAATPGPTASAAPSSTSKFNLSGLSMGVGFQSNSPSQPPSNSFSSTQPQSTAAAFAGTSATKPSGFGGGAAFGQTSNLGATPSGGFGQPSQLGSAAPGGLGASPSSSFGQTSQLGARSPTSGMPAAFGGGGAAFGQPATLGANPSAGFGAGSSTLGSGFGAGTSQLGGGHAAAAAAMMGQGQRPMGGGTSTGGFGAIAGAGNFGGGAPSSGFGGIGGGQQPSGFGGPPGGASQWTQARK